MDARGIGRNGSTESSKTKLHKAQPSWSADVDCRGRKSEEKRKPEEHLTKQSKIENICTIQPIETQEIDYAFQLARFLFCSTFSVLL